MSEVDISYRLHESNYGQFIFIRYFCHPVVFENWERYFWKLFHYLQESLPVNSFHAPPLTEGMEQIIMQALPLFAYA